ncbi:MAG: hypothetical protein Q8Q30_00640 [Candidatus Woesebacteria bacterium]|nr:hypothetical protein [Candidatus Woesebacteria bacterium]
MLIPTVNNVKTITDMREDALGLLNSVNEQGLAYIFHRSKPKAVLLNIADFILLQQMAEDYEDYKDVLELKKEKRGKGILLSEIVKKYV